MAILAILAIPGGTTDSILAPPQTFDSKTLIRVCTQFWLEWPECPNMTFTEVEPPSGRLYRSTGWLPGGLGCPLSRTSPKGPERDRKGHSGPFCLFLPLLAIPAGNSVFKAVFLPFWAVLAILALLARIDLFWLRNDRARDEPLG